MSIQIKAKRMVDGNNKKCYRVIEVNALRHNEIPEKYKAGNLFLFKDNRWNKTGSKIKPCLAILESARSDKVLMEGEVYPEEQFNQFVELCRKCGNLLHEINHEKKQMEAAWNGEVEVII